MWWPKDSAFLQSDNFVDTSVQEAGICGFSGCQEHANVIWHQIQTAKKEKSPACGFPRFYQCLCIGASQDSGQLSTSSQRASESWSKLTFRISSFIIQFIIQALRWVVRGEHLKNGLCFPPIGAYMDDMTTITPTKVCHQLPAG